MFKKLIFILLIFLVLSCTESFQQHFNQLQNNNTLNIEYSFENFTVKVSPHNYVTHKNALVMNVQTLNEKNVKEISIIIKHTNNQLKAYIIKDKKSTTKEMPLLLGKNIIKIKVTNHNGSSFTHHDIAVYYLWQEKQTFPASFYAAQTIKNNFIHYILGGYYRNSLYIYSPISLPHIQTYHLKNSVYYFINAFYNDRIFVMGGFSSDSLNAYNELSIYDVSNVSGQGVSISSSSTINPDYARAASAYAQIGQLLYIFGGYNTNGNVVNTIVKYNLNTQQFDTQLVPTVDNQGKDISITYSKAVVYDINNDNQDEIILIGGSLGKQIYVFYPQTNALKLLDAERQLSIERTKGHGVIKLGDKVYIIGGQTAAGDLLNTIEVLCLKTFSLKTLKPMPFNISDMALSIHSTQILLMGGKTQTKNLNQVFYYSPHLDELNDF